jgi:NAD(P)-dependent dehydrogenase (short-subunit alcohol dehydrogenase family)
MGVMTESTALVTGGTSGIGRAAANKLAQLGYYFLVVGRNVQRGEKTVAEIRAAGGKADFISPDLRDASNAREVARRAVKLGSGHVDIAKQWNTGDVPFRRAGTRRPAVVRHADATLPYPAGRA